VVGAARSRPSSELTTDFEHRTGDGFILQVMFFTRPSVSTFDRYPFQLTDEFFYSTEQAVIS